MEKEVLYKLYVEEGLSQREVAERLRCSQSNVRHWMKVFGIQPRHQVQYSGGVKLCPRCQKDLPLSEFIRRKDSSTKNPEVLNSWCRKCNNQNAIARQQENKRLAVIYKGGSCVVCGFSLYVGALEFHHLDPSKKDLKISGYSKIFEKIKEEVDKCVLLCANCHRLTHAQIIQLDRLGNVVKSPY